MSSKEKKAGFSICGTKGFHVRTPSGWTLSVQFGGGNYCDNYDEPINDEPVPPSANAEIAVWETSNFDERGWLDLGDDDVAGHVTVLQVVDILGLLVAYGPDYRGLVQEKVQEILSR